MANNPINNLYHNKLNILNKNINMEAFKNIKPIIPHDADIERVEKYILFESLQGKAISYLLYDNYNNIKEFCKRRYLAFAYIHELYAGATAAEDLRCERTIRILAELLAVFESHGIFFTVIDRFILLSSIWARDLGWLTPETAERLKILRDEKRPSTLAEIHCEMGARFIKDEFHKMGIRYPEIKNRNFYRYFSEIISNSHAFDALKEPKPPSLFPLAFAISQLVYLHDYRYMLTDCSYFHAIRDYQHHKYEIDLLPLLLYLILDSNDINLGSSDTKVENILIEKIEKYCKADSVNNLLNVFNENYKIFLPKLWGIYRLALSLDPWNHGELTLGQYSAEQDTNVNGSSIMDQQENRDNHKLEYLWKRPRWFVRFISKNDRRYCNIESPEVRRGPIKKIEKFMQSEIDTCLDAIGCGGNKTIFNIFPEYISPLKKSAANLADYIEIWNKYENFWSLITDEQKTGLSNKEISKLKDKTDLILSRLRLEIVSFPFQSYLQIIKKSLEKPDYDTIYRIIDVFHLIKEKTGGIVLILVLALLKKCCQINNDNVICRDKKKIKLCAKIIENIGILKYKSGFKFLPVIEDEKEGLNSVFHQEIEELHQKYDTIKYFKHLEKELKCIDHLNYDNIIKKALGNITSEESLYELLIAARLESNPTKKNTAKEILENANVSPVFSKINLEYNFWKLCYWGSNTEKAQKNNKEKNALEKEFEIYLENKPNIRKLIKLANIYNANFLNYIAGTPSKSILDALLNKDNKIFVFAKPDIWLIKDRRDLIENENMGKWLFNSDILSMKKNAEPLAIDLAGKNISSYFSNKMIPDKTLKHISSSFENMSDIENLISISKENIYSKFFRDHINHSIRVMLLMDRFAKYYLQDEYGNTLKTKFSRIFSLCGLFHDVGLPIAESETVLSAIYEKINELSVDSHLVVKGIKSMKGLEVTSLRDIEIVQFIQSLPETCFSSDIHGKEIINNTEQKSLLYSSLIKNFANIEHDIVGAVIVADILQFDLKTIPYIISGQINNINKSESEKFLILQAIALHNIVHTSDLSKNNKISYEQYPLLVSLIVCDELQEWGRALGLGGESIVQEAQLEEKQNEKTKKVEELVEEIQYMTPEILMRSPVPFEPLLQMAGKYRVFSRVNFQGFPIKLKVKMYFPSFKEDSKDGTNYKFIPDKSNNNQAIYKNERTLLEVIFKGIDNAILESLNEPYFEINIDNKEIDRAEFRLKDKSNFDKMVKIDEIKDKKDINITFELYSESLKK